MAPPLQVVQPRRASFFLPQPFTGRRIEGVGFYGPFRTTNDRLLCGGIRASAYDAGRTARRNRAARKRRAWCVRPCERISSREQIPSAEPSPARTLRTRGPHFLLSSVPRRFSVSVLQPSDSPLDSAICVPSKRRQNEAGKITPSAGARCNSPTRACMRFPWPPPRLCVTMPLCARPPVKPRSSLGRNKGEQGKGAVEAGSGERVRSEADL